MAVRRCRDAGSPAGRSSVSERGREAAGAGKPFYWFSPDFWLTPKHQVHRGEQTSAAIGVWHLVAPGAGSSGIAYAVATRGTPDRAATFGLGWGYRGKSSFRVSV